MASNYIKVPPETDVQAVVELAFKAIALSNRNGELERILREKDDTILTLQDDKAKLEVILNTI